MESSGRHLRVLVVAPTRRDGQVTEQLLKSNDIEFQLFNGLAKVADELDHRAGALLLTDAVLTDPRMQSLIDALQKQPSWSDVPIVLMMQDKVRSPLAARSLLALSNVTLLDRPTSTQSIVSAIKAALRSRQRQYQIRDQFRAQDAALSALQKAEEALRDANQRKDEFLATLAHELRNPLAAVRTAVQVVLRKSPNEERNARMLQMIDRQSRMLGKLIDDLMDVSRISTGKVVLQRARCDLRSVLETGLESGQTTFDASLHEIRLDQAPGPVWVMGDASRLAQVVGNLINNACKYTPDGGRITVSLAQEGNEAVVRVADSGVGIAPELLEEVFEMFAQVDLTMDRARGGLGIGLSLVRRLVGLHGGTVTAESAGVGQGSTFTLRLPIDTEDVAQPAASGMPSDDKAATLHVLVIDDNHDVADGLAALIADSGHDVKIAYDGFTGLEMATRLVPQIIFCDIGMPLMNGRELAARLRSHPQRNAMYMVAVTGWGNDEDRRQSVTAGFDAHLHQALELRAARSGLCAVLRRKERAARCLPC